MYYPSYAKFMQKRSTGISMFFPIFIEKKQAGRYANNRWIIRMIYILLSIHLMEIDYSRTEARLMELIFIPIAIVFVAMFIHAVNDVSKVRKELELVKKQNEEIIELLKTRKKSI
jgi:hypothetical protein